MRALPKINISFLTSRAFILIIFYLSYSMKSFKNYSLTQIFYKNNYLKINIII